MIPRDAGRRYHREGSRRRAADPGFPGRREALLEPLHEGARLAHRLERVGAEYMEIESSTPFICCSIGIATASSAARASAPT
jgi:hypothetical protein